MLPYASASPVYSFISSEIFSTCFKYLMAAGLFPCTFVHPQLIIMSHERVDTMYQVPEPARRCQVAPATPRHTQECVPCYSSHRSTRRCTKEHVLERLKRLSNNSASHRVPGHTMPWDHTTIRLLAAMPRSARRCRIRSISFWLINKAFSNRTSAAAPAAMGPMFTVLREGWAGIT